jgi:uncharacterized cupredoxin-like copper-binding protein
LPDVIRALALGTVVMGLACLAPSAFASASTPGNRVDVTLRDFKVKVSTHAVRSGRVVLHIDNHGPSTHELNLDRTDLPSGSLPLQADGLTVDEKSPRLHRIDSVEQLNLGESGDLAVRLRPGHYVLYCNLEGHYLGGMHASFDVVSTAS